MCQARFLLRDLTTASIADIAHVDVVVATYVLHELADSRELELLLEATSASRSKTMFVGDVSFPHAAARRAAREAFSSHWDDGEHYFAAREFASFVGGHRLVCEYRQISVCAGAYAIRAL